MIELKGIKKSFGSLEVLKGIDLHIDKGEVVSIVGPSGAGKTTLLQIMGTLDQPDSGRIVIHGEDVSGFSQKRLARFRNQHLGFVFQFHQLLPEFTALENVMIPALIAGRDEAESKEEATKLLTRLGLAERASHHPNELSGGEKQRVAVARALINKPQILFADEPTGNLDSKTTKEVMEMIRKFARTFHQTIVLVSHDPEMTEYADRIVTLVDGEIISDVKTENFCKGETR